MSREVRRVPLDFEFPLGDTWTGYLMPADLHLPQCPDCAGRGSTTAMQWLDSIARLLLMLGDDIVAQQRGQGLHPYLDRLENRPYPMNRPSLDAMELTTGLAGSRPDAFFGYESTAAWATTNKIREAAGLPETWGTCTTCSGEGEVATPEQRAAYEAWTETPPPTGEGWQLWQTVSEGGPVSPVVATPEELADWIIASGEDLHGARTPRNKLIRWIAEDGVSAGSFAMVPGRGMVSGVELAAGVES